MTRLIFTIFVTTATVSIIVGCGDKNHIRLVEAHGVVAFEGKALANATVIFVPDQGPIAMGATNESGQFTLSTNGSPGVATGKCRVSISHNPAEAEDEELKGLSESERNEKLTQRMGKNVGKFGSDRKPSRVPNKFASADTSGLEAIVLDDPNKNSFEFNLQ